MNLPVRAEAGAPVYVRFFSSEGRCINEELIPASGENEPPVPDFPAVIGAAILVEDTEHQIRLHNDKFEARIDKTRGVLLGMWNARGTPVLGMGPFLHAPYYRLGCWKCSSVRLLRRAKKVIVTITGSYKDSLALSWMLCFEKDGILAVSYRIEKVTGKLPKNIKLRVGVDEGGLDELGIIFEAAKGMDTFSYGRRYVNETGKYNRSPKGTLTQNPGSVHLDDRAHAFGETPELSFEDDAVDDILNGRYDPSYHGSNLFRATKEDVAWGVVYQDGAEEGLGLLGGDCSHIRLEVMDPEEKIIKDTDTRIHYSGTWYTERDEKGSDHGTEHWSHEKDAVLTLSFQGKGIVWYGPQDTICGCAEVTLDDRDPVRICQCVPGVDYPCSSAGYDKKYHIPIWSAAGLPQGTHTLKIRVLDEGVDDSKNTYIIIDYFRVLDNTGEQFRIIANHDFAFPHISWGNYRKAPIWLKEADTGCIRFFLVETPGQNLRRVIEDSEKEYRSRDSGK